MSAMFSDLHFAYLVGSSRLLVLWLILYFRRKDLRREMVLMSCIIAVVGPLSQFFYLRDYWQPELFNGWRIGIEDAFFGFGIGGLAAVAYEELFRRAYAIRKTRAYPTLTVAIVPFAIVWMLIGNIWLGFNSIYVSASGLFFVGVVLLVLRRDLLRNALVSGVLLGFLFFVFYTLFDAFVFPGAVREFWMWENISGILIGGAPLEEILWAFSWGFLGGPLYEFASGRRLRKAAA